MEINVTDMESSILETGKYKLEPEKLYQGYNQQLQHHQAYLLVTLPTNSLSTSYIIGYLAP
jgi:hypothetical protein